MQGLPRDYGAVVSHLKLQDEPESAGPAAPMISIKAAFEHEAAIVLRMTRDLESRPKEKTDAGRSGEEAGVSCSRKLSSQVQALLFVFVPVFVSVETKHIE